MTLSINVRESIRLVILSHGFQPFIVVNIKGLKDYSKLQSNSNPSLDPAFNDSLAGSIQFAFQKMMQQTDGMLPAQVIAYDRTNNRVQVQILISLITTSNTIVPRPQIASIPVLVIGGGGFMLSFPLKTGDLGWVLASDRDISLFLQTYNQTPPNTYRIKNFSDSLFIPDIMRNYTINPEDEMNAVLSSTDGTVRISLSSTQVKITAPMTIVTGSLTVAGALVAEGGFTGSGGGGVNPFQITGNLLVTGNIGATGTITPEV